MNCSFRYVRTLVIKPTVQFVGHNRKLCFFYFSSLCSEHNYCCPSESAWHRCADRQALFLHWQQNEGSPIQRTTTVPNQSRVMRGISPPPPTHTHPLSLSMSPNLITGRQTSRLARSPRPLACTATQGALAQAGRHISTPLLLCTVPPRLNSGVLSDRRVQG